MPEHYSGEVASLCLVSEKGGTVGLHSIVPEPVLFKLFIVIISIIVDCLEPVWITLTFIQGDWCTRVILNGLHFVWVLRGTRKQILLQFCFDLGEIPAKKSYRSTARKYCLSNCCSCHKKYDLWHDGFVQSFKKNDNISSNGMWWLHKFMQFILAKTWS